MSCQRRRSAAVGADTLRAAISARLRSAGASGAGAAISPQSSVRAAGIVVSCVRLDSVILAPLPVTAVYLLYVMRLALSSTAVCFFLGHECASQLARSSDLADQSGRGKAEV